MRTTYVLRLLQIEGKRTKLYANNVILLTLKKASAVCAWLLLVTSFTSHMQAKKAW